MCYIQDCRVASFFPNLRHLRALCEVAQLQSISRASETMHISQPAITQAIAKLEEQLGIALFDRRKGGMFLTEAGKPFADRVARALELVEAGADEVLASKLENNDARPVSSFYRHITSSQLRALVAVAATSNFSLAARLEGVRQPSLYRAARSLETLAGVPFYEKNQKGITLTPVAKVLSKNARLALAELEQAFHEVHFNDGGDAGSLVIGAMPLARASILPHVIQHVGAQYPDMKFTIIDGSYDDLLHRLRHGSADILIGALRHDLPVDDVTQETLFKDTLAVVVRPGHPLAGQRAVTISDLANCSWIVPREGTPARDCFVSIFNKHDCPVPTGQVETGSLILARNLLLESDHVALVSALQVQREIDLGLLVRVPFEVEGTLRTIGLTMRKHWCPTSVQRQCLNYLRSMSFS